MILKADLHCVCVCAAESVYKAMGTFTSHLRVRLIHPIIELYSNTRTEKNSLKRSK